MLEIIVFSKDRACQLELFLRSMKEFFKEFDKCSINILYKASNSLFEEGYEKLKKEYSKIEFVNETDFKSNIIDIIQKSNNDYVCFFVDDIVWKEPFSLDCVEFNHFKLDESLLCFSLRLHKELTYCYANNESMSLPFFISENPLVWNWKVSTHDWNYPFSVDGHIFRKKLMLSLVKELNYHSPNSFEVSFYPLTSRFDLDKMMCLEKAPIFNIPFNKVQNEFNNKCSNKISIDEMNNRFLNGNIISMKNLRHFKNNSVHQEVDLVWEGNESMNIFKIIIPCYNVESWIIKTISSVLDQTYENWKAIIFDDGSTDTTLEKIKSVLQNSPKKDKFIVKRKNINSGGILENHIYCINEMCKDDEDIIVLLDGDDWFYSNDVLQYLNEVYKDKDIWLTYGNYICINPTFNLNRPLVSTRTYRKNLDWCTSHLKTFKYKLFKGIDREDLYYNGHFIKMAGDMALMYPMIEMAGMKRIKFIERPLYVYNNINPLNEDKKNVTFQLLMRQYIQNKKEYDEL